MRFKCTYAELQQLVANAMKATGEYVDPSELEIEIVHRISDGEPVAVEVK